MNLPDIVAICASSPEQAAPSRAGLRVHSADRRRPKAPVRPVQFDVNSFRPKKLVDKRL